MSGLESSACDALKKRAISEYTFIQEYTSNFIDEQTENLKSKGRMIKKQKQVHEEHEAAAVTRANESVSESDAVFLDGVEESVGTCIKRRAARLYNQYEQLCDNDDFECLCLGFNSILDLSCKYGSGQSTLFTIDQWKSLKARFLVKNAWIINDKISRKLTKAENRAISDCGKAYKKLKCYELDARDATAEVVYFIYSHATYLLHKHKYLFQRGVNKSEADYMIKVWAPIFENLFAGTAIRAKWGDTQGRYSETSTITIKADLRVLSDKPLPGNKQEIDLVDSEFASMQAGSSKFSTDHVKVLVEGKLLVDHMIELVDIDDLSMFVMQVHGLELVMYSITLCAPGLYVATTFGKIIFPESESELPQLRKLVEKLLSMKERVLNVEQRIKSTSSSKTQRIDDGTPPLAPQTKGTWTRDTWCPPVNNRSPAPLPESFVSN